MKTAIVILAVFFAISVDAASHSKKHAMKTSKAAEDKTEWPQPDVIRDFGVPPEFTENPSNFTPTPPGDDYNNENTTPSASGGKHHGKSSHKSHSH